MSSTREAPEQYDLIALGSGEGGKSIAWHYSSTQGKRCAVVEHKWYGGLVSQRRLAVVMHAVLQRKREMVQGQIGLHRSLFESSGAEMVWGRGKLVGPKTIEVSDGQGGVRVMRSEIIVICTGSEAVVPNITGLKEAEPLTHVGLLELEELPQHLIILGGGYVGLEFAQGMRRFGAKVTLVEHNERILKREDKDVSDLMQQVLEREGVTVLTSTTLTSVSGSSGKIVTLKGKNTASATPITITGSHVLCAAGRTANTDNLGLDLTGVKLTETGFVVVDEHLQTSAPGIFATGDCAGSPQFTHMGFDDFRVVRDNLTGSGNGGNASNQSSNRRSARQVPSTLFTDPQLAHVGLREHEAKAQGMSYRLAQVPMSAFLKTHTMASEGDTTGFAKALISNEDDTILGFTAIGVEAGELLPVVQLAMQKSLAYMDVAELIIVHPTFHEGLTYLFNAVPPRT
ncbi:hypothetical protein LTR86_010943 [Recurvomyces mirabilis]|nr:hypothetical protein LTR86_010943 [Recurvomyces mirabilis]